MPSKFGRSYVLEIGPKISGPITQIPNVPAELTVTLPFTIEFDITRHTLTSANVCQIRIYNLSADHRNLVRFNAYDYGTYQSITLRAGYNQTLLSSATTILGNTLPILFTGNISRAWSVREGVNFITQIECYDGGFAFANGTTNMNFPAGTPKQIIIATLASTLPNVSVGAIGTFPGVIPRANTYSGNTIDILNELTGKAFFIDNGKSYALGTNEVLINPAGFPIINTASGLLNTPILEQNVVRFDMLFEPTLQPGQEIILASVTEPSLNGNYKVTTVKHRGMISEAVCGEAITQGEFLYNAAPVPVVSLG